MKDLDTQKIIAEGGNIALIRLMRNGLSANPEVHPSHSSSSLHSLFSFDPIDQPNLARRHRHAGTVTQAPCCGTVSAQETGQTCGGGQPLQADQRL